MTEKIAPGAARQEAVLTPEDLAKLAAALDKVRSQLADEAKKRRDLIKPMERALWALKDPHRNAVALHEATALLAKPAEELTLPESYPALVNQLRSLAESKLSELEFTFARDLRAAFEQVGVNLSGPPSELIADLFVIKVDMMKKQVEMTFSKQPVTSKTIKLDVDQVVAAYQRARREICERNTNMDELIKELFEAYQRTLQLAGKALGTRIGIVDFYRELVLIRQPSSFRKSPSKLSFVDYPKSHFIYDMLQIRQQNKLTYQGQRINFGAATIEVGSDSSRAMFLAIGALEGNYMKDIHFSVEKKS